MLMSKYVNSRQARDTVLRAEFARQQIERAVEGESLAKLKNAKNEEARIIKSQRTIVVPFAEFNRADDDEKRSERVFRVHLLPGILELVSPNFKLNEEGILVPANFTEIATLDMPERSVSVVRTMVSVQEVTDVHKVNQDKVLETGALPGLVSFQMIVEDLPAQFNPSV